MRLGQGMSWRLHLVVLCSTGHLADALASEQGWAVLSRHVRSESRVPRRGASGLLRTAIGPDAQLQFLRAESGHMAGHSTAASAGTPPAAALPDGTLPANVKHLDNKPQGDHRDYQFSVLENGLQVLNIHDNSTEMAALALAVTAGLYYDPPEHYGLAHLTEHSLFLGTRRYNQSSGFDEFLAENGGESNAYTAEEETVYYASLGDAGFNEGVDRFADMFQAPLLNATRIWKEVSAVVSEHSKNIQNPAWYSERVMLAAGNPASPAQHFHTGDAQTLLNLGKENLTREMRTYFKRNYCPPRMRLVTFSSSSLEEQLVRVTETFGNIPAGGEARRCAAKPQTFEQPGAFPESRLHQWLLVEGTTSSPMLWLLFPLKDLAPWHKSHPLKYAEYLLSWGGKNGLNIILRDQLGLADFVSLSADDGSAGTMVWVTVSLTLQGVEHPQAVLDVIFTYLNHARHWCTDQPTLRSLASSALLLWDWPEPMDAEKATSTFAEEMTRLSPEELLSADYLMEDPNITRVKEVLGMLRPQHVNVGFVLPNAALIWDSDPYKMLMTLPHYGLRYNKSGLDDWFGDWRRWGEWHPTGHPRDIRSGYANLTQRLQAAGVNFTGPLLIECPGEIQHIPDPDELTLNNAQAMRGKSLVSHLFGVSPHLIGDNISEELWFRKGWTVPQPRVAASMTFRAPVPDHPPSAYDVVKLQVGMHLLNDELNQRLADVGYKGFSFSFSETHSGMYVWVSSFTKNLLHLTKRMLQQIRVGLEGSAHNSTDAGEYVDGEDEDMDMEVGTLDSLGAEDGDLDPLTFDDMDLALEAARNASLVRILHSLLSDLSDSGGEAIKTAFADRKVLLTPRLHSRVELVQALNEGPEITFDGAAKAVREARQMPFYASTVIVGNCDEEQATTLHGMVIGGLGAGTGAAASQVERVQPVVRPGAPAEVRKANPREGDRNHVTLVTVLLGPATVASRVLLGIVGGIYQQVVFAELRTRRELGYVVGGSVSEISTVLAVDCYVQGEKMLPDEVEQQCENVWAISVPHEIKSLDDDAFNSHKESFRGSLLEGPLTADAEHSHFEDPILLGGCFELRESMLAYLDEQVTSKDQLLEAWLQAVQPKNASMDVPHVRRKLTVKYFGAGSEVLPPPEASDAGNNVTDDDAALRLSLERERTEVYSEASSTVRDNIVAQGGYFPTDLHCKWSTPQSLTAKRRKPQAKAKKARRQQSLPRARHGAGGAGVKAAMRLETAALRAPRVY